MNEKVFQKIYDEINNYLTPNWDKVIIYLEYGEASYSFSFYVKNGKDYTKCYDLPGVSEDSLDKSFKEIDKTVSKERNKEKTPWSNMTMVVDNRGDMHTDFDYTDLSGGTYQYKKSWKNKYLK